MSDLNVVELIAAKRDGRVLEPDAIRNLIDAYTDGNVADYQMSALLMAALLRGMNDAETFALTDAMLRSGITIDLSDIPGLKVGKHSTGGVGDKVSLILAPVVASCGVPVPKLSGRGLGFTGGTLDKLESIPGFRTDLSIDQYVRQLREIGVVITGQTDEIAPADRALYALRDVTATVEFIPFIASSIMSKKVAEGIDALVLDVKCGRGAFMKEDRDARKLAETIAEIGERFGKRTIAWMTRMDAPLGRTVGNWPEVVEAVECLQGAHEPDLVEIIQTLGGEMIWLGGKAASRDEGKEAAAEALSSGRAYDKLVEMVEMQGGDADLLRSPGDREGVEPAGDVTASGDGYVASVDALAVGRTSVMMGAGRMRKGEDVDPLAGIVLSRKPGDLVRQGETLALLYTTKTGNLESFASSLEEAFVVQDDPPDAEASVLIDRYADGTWDSKT